MTTANSVNKGCCEDCCVEEKEETVEQFETQKSLTLRIRKMDCSAEESLIRKKLDEIDGIRRLDFNLFQHILKIDHQLRDISPIISALESVGMDPVLYNGVGQSESVYRIEKMCCSTEASLIEAKLNSMAGIEGLDFNLIQNKLTVRHSLSHPAAIEKALKEIGMEGVPIEGRTAPVLPAAEKPFIVRNSRWILLILGAIAAVMSEIMALTSGREDSWPVISLAVFAILASGIETYKKGWIALKNLDLNINALMSIAVTGAVAIGEWPEAGMVMVLFSLAELIEAKSLDRARNAIRELMEMAPDRATVRQADGNWLEVDAESVGKGSVVRVKPGERIPLDGEITAGESTVNQAPITGESIPVAKVPGDTVFAGTINGNGSLDFKVTADAAHSTLARIIEAVEEAQGSRAPTQRFVDKFAGIYTPLVFAVALLVAVVPPLAFGMEWMDWIYKGLVLLVIACPCALVISTPVSVVSGLAAAARKGILIKGGVYLEDGRNLKVLALDKTGTLTSGYPQVTDIIGLNGREQEGFRLAAGLSARSDHPVSSAVTAYYRSEFDSTLPDDITEFRAIAGRGIKGRLGSRSLYLGNHRLMEELGIRSIEAERAMEKLESEGKTAVAVCDDASPLAVIGVADTVRETSRQAIADLDNLGIRTVMLTGDNQKTADAIARQVGIDNARGNLLPEEKLQAIDEELEAYGQVGMVGDGINDAPALAKASIGFAMGAAGTDTAIETADVALMKDDLRKLPEFIRLSRRTAAILKQNILLALGIKGLFFGLAVMGLATLWMAVFADMGTSLLVVFNGLRLLKA